MADQTSKPPRTNKQKMITAAAVVAGAAILGFLIFGGNGTKANRSVEGTVLDVSPEENFVVLRLETNEEVTLAFTPETKFFDADGTPTDVTYVRKGFSARAEGTPTSIRTVVPKEIHITRTPNISIFSPESDDETSFPLVVRGEARVFENALNVRLKDEDGSVLEEVSVMAESEDVGLYGPFETSFTAVSPKGTAGAVEAFSYSAKDGLEINTVSVPVRFKQSELMTLNMTLKAFFPNRTTDPNPTDCKKVYPVERMVPKTVAVARASLEELLKGPTDAESREGFITTINPGVKIQSIAIQEGVARVTLSKELGEGVGGSCRVAAIRAQITETLKQFSTVSAVTLSMDGVPDD